MWKVGLFLLLSVQLGISTSVNAAVAAVGTNTLHAQSVQKVTAIGAGIEVDYTVKRNDLAGKDWYSKHKVKYGPKSALKRLMNARKRLSPVDAALLAAVAAAGWIIDELTGQIMTPSAPDPDYVSGFYWLSYLNYGTGRTKAEACNTFPDTYVSGNYCYVTNGGGAIIKQRSCAGQTIAACQGEAPLLEGSAINDSQGSQLYSDLINQINLMSPADKRALFSAAGVPILTPELQAALQAYSDALEEDALVPSSEEVNDETQEDKQEDNETEEDNFCTTFGIQKLCDWIWDEKELEDNSIDLQKISVSKVGFDAHLGGGSCPQSHSVNGMYPVSSEWGEVCGFASGVIKPIFLLLCSLSAAYILAGIKTSQGDTA